MLLQAKKHYPVFFRIEKNIKNIKIKVTWSLFLNMGTIAIPGSIDKEDFCYPDAELDLNSWIQCDKEITKKKLN